MYSILIFVFIDLNDRLVQHKLNISDITFRILFLFD